MWTLGYKTIKVAAFPQDLNYMYHVSRWLLLCTDFRRRGLLGAWKVVCNALGWSMNGFASLVYQTLR